MKDIQIDFSTPHTTYESILNISKIFEDYQLRSLYILAGLTSSPKILFEKTIVKQFASTNELLQLLTNLDLSKTHKVDIDYENNSLKIHLKPVQETPEEVEERINKHMILFEELKTEICSDL